MFLIVTLMLQVTQYLISCTQCLLREQRDKDSLCSMAMWSLEMLFCIYKSFYEPSEDKAI